MDPTDILDASERRKISCICWYSDHDYLVIQPININDNNICNIFITAGNEKVTQPGFFFNDLLCMSPG